MVVVGGSNSYDTLDSVELLSLDNGSNKFLEGPKMPKSLSRHNMVEFKNKLYVIGGYDGGYYSSAIYEMYCNTVCSWRKMEQELKYVMASMVFMIAPDTFCNE